MEKNLGENAAAARLPHLREPQHCWGFGLAYPAAELRTRAT
jgi:hypothetical protein